MSDRRRQILTFFSGVPFAVVYALVAHLTFRDRSGSGLLALMSYGFIFVVPLAIGALTVAFSAPSTRRSLLYGVFAP